MSLSDRLRPVVVLLAGLIGAAGVALAAAATHVAGDGLIGPASAMALAHAPAMVALVAAQKAIRTATGAALVMGLGVALFMGDLTLRQFSGVGLFPMAAPAGGISMITGWLAVAAGALLPPRRDRG